MKQFQPEIPEALPTLGSAGEVPDVAAPRVPATQRTGAAVYLNVAALPIWAVHLAAIAGVLYMGWSWSGLALAVGSYYLRMFFLTAGYHRYFSHRTYKTSRAFQLFLAFMGQTSSQKGALWWAANHRAHHRHSDEPADLHSAKQRGFWWSHIGWILSDAYNSTDRKRITDFARYPELRLLDHPSLQLLPSLMYAGALYLVGGTHALLWGSLVSTTLLWHGTFTINSLSHMFGKRRYATSDDSRNNWLLALITMGEGWHNNHHHYQSAARQGFFWWEIDLSYYALRALAALGLIWDLRSPPKDILARANVPADTAPEVSEIG